MKTVQEMLATGLAIVERRERAEQARLDAEAKIEDAAWVKLLQAVERECGELWHFITPDCRERFKSDRVVALVFKPFDAGTIQCSFFPRDGSWLRNDRFLVTKGFDPEFDGDLAKNGPKPSFVSVESPEEALAYCHRATESYHAALEAMKKS